MLEPFALDRAGARVRVSGSAWLQPPGSLSPSGSGAVTPWAALPSVQSFSFIITALCAVLFLQYSRHLQWPQVQLLLPQSKHPILGEGTCWILLFGSFYCFFLPSSAILVSVTQPTRCTESPGADRSPPGSRAPRGAWGRAACSPGAVGPRRAPASAARSLPLGKAGRSQLVFV